MSKKALSFALTLLMTISILSASVLSAFAESIPAPSEYDLAQETSTAGESVPDASAPTGTAPAPTVSKALYPVLTVNAISNYFGKAYAEYNEFTREVTVTYMLKASKRLVSADWKLTYDSAVLSVDPQKNPREAICPVIKDKCAVSFEDGVITYDATDLNMFDFTAKEAPFAQIIFDVAPLTANDSEITKVDLSVENLRVSEPDPATGLSVSSKERVLVANSKEIENKKTDAVLVTKVTSLTPSTFSEPDLSGATPDQALTTAPVTVPATTAPQPTTLPVKQEPKEKAPQKSDNTLVPTGEWYVAALILLVLFICGLVLFILRKRDIYNN